MGIATIISLIISFGALITGFILEHGDVMSLFLLSPAVIVFGGTIGALMVSYSINDVVKMPLLVIRASSNPKMSLQKTINTILDLAVKVKKGGILILEPLIHDQSFVNENDA